MAGGDRPILQEGFGETLAEREEISGLERVDILTGGFPCQPHSVAGERTGRDDDRWLWPEFKTAIRALRPQIVVVENVPGLLTTAFGDVLGGLAEIGFDAEWATLRASEFGAPHRRERLFVIAYPERERLQGREQHARIFVPEKAPYTERCDSAFREWCEMETAIRGLRECDGISVQMVRNMVKPFGNSLLPQIAEWIGRRIVEASISS